MPVISEIVSEPPSPKLPDLYEVVNGEIKELPPMGARHYTIASRLLTILSNFVDAGRLGQVVHESLFHLRDDCPERRPDLAFISVERWPFDLEGPEDNAWAVVPDLAVEVISPSNGYDEIRDKINEYFAAGVRVVWVVSPSRQEIELFQPAGVYRLVKIDDDLLGDPVLPGLVLPLRRLFSKRYQ